MESKKRISFFFKKHSFFSNQKYLLLNSLRFGLGGTIGAIFSFVCNDNDDWSGGAGGGSIDGGNDDRKTSWSDDDDEEEEVVVDDDDDIVDWWWTELSAIFDNIGTTWQYNGLPIVVCILQWGLFILLVVVVFNWLSFVDCLGRLLII